MQLEDFLKEQSFWAKKLLIDNIYFQRCIDPRKVSTWRVSNPVCKNIDENRCVLSLSEAGFRYYPDWKQDKFISLMTAPFDTMMDAMLITDKSFTEQPEGTVLIYNLDDDSIEWWGPERYSMPEDELREKLIQMSYDTAASFNSKNKGD